MHVVGTEAQRDEVRDHRRQQAGQQGAGGHAADCHHLDAPDGASNRRAEHGGEAGCHAGRDDHGAGVIAHLEQFAQLVGQGAAHLHRRTLAPDRRAEQVRGQGAEQHQRCHAQRDGFRGHTGFVDQQINAGVAAGAKAPVQPGHHEAGHRQQPDQPAVLSAPLRDRVEREQERGRGSAGQHADQA